MRRRITLSILGTVAAALVLAGLGTLLLVRGDARDAAQEELAGQAAAIGELVQASARQLDRATPNVEPRPRERLHALREQLDLDGIGFLVLGSDGALVPELSDAVPPGVPLDELDVEALQRDEVLTGGRGNEVWAAATISRRPAAITPIVVVTTTIDPVPGPTFRWFLLASAVTLALAAVVAERLGRALARPVRDAQAATARIAEGDLAVRLERRPESAAHRDELDELADAINAMAAALERSRGLERQFLLSVSHDLRTPLTSIRGYAEAITDGAAPDPAAAARVILDESRRLDRLVRDLLDLARLDARRFTLDRRVVDLDDLVASAAEGFRRETELAGLDLHVVRTGTPVFVDVDPDRLGQVLANLVENAVKFARSRVEVTVGVGVDGARVTVTVADDGPGISGEDLPHVFERLYVAGATPARKEVGSGLGLAIAKELVEAMDGTVAAASTAGAGTRMVVSLPVTSATPR